MRLHFDKKVSSHIGGRKENILMLKYRSIASYG